MNKFGISKADAPYYLPPYEWYNDTISKWTSDLGLTLINYSPGTSSNADYTIPSMSNYLNSDTIYNRILKYENSNQAGLNGFIFLSHIGTHPERTDKFYNKLDILITELKKKGYKIVTLEELLKE